MWHGLEQAP